MTIDNKFEIAPILGDVPGGDHWLALSAFLEINKPLTRRAIIVVLSPILAGDKNINTKRDIGDVDKEFIMEQLGWVRGVVCGSLGWTNIRKPKAIIMFFAKFDAFCDLNPNEVKASDVREAFLAHFEKHRLDVHKACDERDIPYVEIVGSSYNLWEINTIIQAINQATLSRLT